MEYATAEPPHTSAYLWEPIFEILERTLARSVFEIGCGNGAFAHALLNLGCDVVGIDPSTSGISQASKLDRRGRFLVRSHDSADLHLLGQYQAVIAIEVIEHVPDSHRFAKCMLDMMVSNGRGIITTPYHGYAKNLALALVPGAFDRHFDPLTQGGHVKFFSVRTITKLLTDAGARDIRIQRVGRALPCFSKSMIVSFRK